MIEMTMERRVRGVVQSRFQHTRPAAQAINILRCSTEGGSTVRHVTEEFVVTSHTHADGTTYTVVYTGDAEQMAVLTAFAARTVQAAAALAA